MNKALDRLEDALASVAAAMIVFTVIFVPVDVASRYFFGAPITWVYEVTEYILLMVPCLAMAWLARHNGHVVIDVVTARLGERAGARSQRRDPPGGRRDVRVRRLVGRDGDLHELQAHAVIENVLQTPQWMIYICIPLGFALTAIEFARQGVRAAWNGG